MSDYYNSLQYIEDKENGIGPPPANQGGPTVWEIAKH